jgi:hypothetical protein
VFYGPQGERLPRDLRACLPGVDAVMMPATFRRLALALPGSREAAHIAHLHFLVGGRIFATLGYPDDNWAVVKLLPEQQEAFISATPTAFALVKGGWGRNGATKVCLRVAPPKAVRLALAVAWQVIAPDRLRIEQAGKLRPKARRTSRRTIA